MGDTSDVRSRPSGDTSSYAYSSYGMFKRPAETQSTSLFESGCNFVASSIMSPFTPFLGSKDKNSTGRRNSDKNRTPGPAKDLDSRDSLTSMDRDKPRLTFIENALFKHRENSERRQSEIAAENAAVNTILTTTNNQVEITPKSNRKESISVQNTNPNSQACSHNPSRRTSEKSNFSTLFVNVATTGMRSRSNSAISIASNRLAIPGASPGHPGQSSSRRGSATLMLGATVSCGDSLSPKMAVPQLASPGGSRRGSFTNLSSGVNPIGRAGPPKLGKRYSAADMHIKQAGKKIEPSMSIPIIVENPMNRIQKETEAEKIEVRLSPKNEMVEQQAMEEPVEKAPIMATKPTRFSFAQTVLAANKEKKEAFYIPEVQKEPEVRKANYSRFANTRVDVGISKKSNVVIGKWMKKTVNKELNQGVRDLISREEDLAGVARFSDSDGE